VNAPPAPVLVVPNVDNMQVLYGEDTTGDSNADRYVPANAVTNLNQVVSLRIALLLRTPNAGVRSSPDDTIYVLNGLPLLPFNTTHFRRVMTITVALRNRVP
jgi:type IV pilus assembly protein PilW